jgi:hypothetical protein
MKSALSFENSGVTRPLNGYVGYAIRSCKLTVDDLRKIMTDALR